MVLNKYLIIIFFGGVIYFGYIKIIGSDLVSYCDLK